MAFMDTYTGFIFWSNIWLSPIALLYPVLQKACVCGACPGTARSTNHLSLSLPCAPEIFWSVICYGTWHHSWGGPCTGTGIACATACHPSYWGLYTGQCIHSFFYIRTSKNWVRLNSSYLFEIWAWATVLYFGPFRACLYSKFLKFLSFPITEL